MAVIGARPATGPWFLGGRTRSRVRPAPKRRIRAHHGAGRRARVRARVDVRGLVVAIVAAFGLAFFYLSQSTHVSATGYEINELQSTLAERRAEQQQLVMEIGQARSPAEITRRARSELRLTPLEEGAVRFAPPSTETSD